MLEELVDFFLMILISEHSLMVLIINVIEYLTKYIIEFYRSICAKFFMLLSRTPLPQFYDLFIRIGETSFCELKNV